MQSAAASAAGVVDLSGDGGVTREMLQEGSGKGLATGDIAMVRFTAKVAETGQVRCVVLILFFVCLQRGGQSDCFVLFVLGCWKRPCFVCYKCWKKSRSLEAKRKKRKTYNLWGKKLLKKKAGITAERGHVFSIFSK